MMTFLNCPRIRKEWDDDPGGFVLLSDVSQTAAPFLGRGSGRIAA
jgi:hypothetical protein